MYRPTLSSLLYVPLRLPIYMKNRIVQRKQTLEKKMEKERPLFLLQGIAPGCICGVSGYNYSTYIKIIRPILSVLSTVCM